MNMPNHPLFSLRQALEMIGYDNNAIGRFRDLKEFRVNMWQSLRAKFTVEQLTEADEDLAMLSDSVLEDVCMGEMPEPMPIKPQTQEILAYAFNHL